MAQRKLKTEWAEEQGSPLSTAREGVMAVQSPARLLQQLLDERNGQLPDPHVELWSHRRAMAFIVASASALWMAILIAGATAATALA
ncbi:hypothetical protein HL653_08675 [Sphingomonas sp. AP4-R1]|uniref:hypothetical protein n=1 Tax=Sphingomonas sp. AP4-R1 TaxID=2735134 RepID=UPI00149353C1|nr:hypothetical protein [Sphingomonas sp. AP4-R1]QJU57855.1 hypothetical protein HL653_08675 [Sphingomonas sp. AP4-R1]